MVASTEAVRGVLAAAGVEAAVLVTEYPDGTIHLTVDSCGRNAGRVARLLADLLIANDLPATASHGGGQAIAAIRPRKDHP